MKEMKVLIAGGGTGGHLFPAIAVAEQFSSFCPSPKITFVGTAKGLEAKIIPLTMWDLILMKVPSLKGAGFFRMIKAVLAMPFAMIEASKILLKVAPDVVISVGGYSAGPITLVAALFGKKTVLMEQNAIPGITNKILGHFVKKVFLTFVESERYFSKNKIVLSGNPVRRKILEAAGHKQVKNSKFTVLVFGGSQGARSINEGMMNALRSLEDSKDDIHIIHQIGRVEDIERYSAMYRAKGFSAEVYHFIEDMAKVYSKVDLVICRAGATSIAELSVMGKPAILIPYPFAADNHQEANARALVEIGAASLILNSELNSELLANEIRLLIEEPLRLAAMSASMRAFGKPDAAKVIVNECMR